MGEVNKMVAVDSLVANEFEVELDGQKVAGVFRISGFVPFKISGSTPTQMQPVHEPFVLAKMVQRDGKNAFNKWLRETVAAKNSSERPRRTLAIVAVDDGVETRRWTARSAWICEVRYSDFDSASNLMVEEIFTIHYDAIEETWSSA